MRRAQSTTVPQHQRTLFITHCRGDSFISGTTWTAMTQECKNGWQKAVAVAHGGCGEEQRGVITGVAVTRNEATSTPKDLC